MLSAIKALLYDKYSVISDHNLLINLSYKLGKLIDNKKDKVIGGASLNSVPYATSISTIYNIPLVLIRKEHDTDNIVKGLQKDMTKCILVKDIITTGSSLLEIIKKITATGIIVTDILVILDKEQGGTDKIKNLGYNIKSLYKLSDLKISTNIPIKTDDIQQNLLNIAKEKESNIILSADLDDLHDIIYLIETIGKYIVGVKLHLDIFRKNTVNYYDFKSELKRLQKKYKFVIIEDRKFADIGSITKRQLELMKDIVDIVTVHSITGPDMLKVIDDEHIGILPILQLSTDNNLIDRIYINKTIDMVNNINHIVGFVAQDRIYPNYLIFSQGVNISNEQRYRTSENVNLDFYMIGKEIYDAKNPLEEVVKYKNICWNDNLITFLT